jgi:galactokinase
MTAAGGGPAADPDRLVEALIRRFPEAAEDRARIEVVQGPGRVNLIGEHTDYNAGLVLTLAIDLRIALALVPSGDPRVEIAWLADAATDTFDLDALPTREVRDAVRGIDYIAGVAWALEGADLPTRGIRAVLASDLPISAGLSSSAALELASAWALLEPAARPADDGARLRLAQLAQRAENEYVGVHCGLMDQFASSLGRTGAALLLDCRTLEFRPIPLPLEHHALVIIDSGSPRRLAASQYNARRQQCERAVAIIAAAEPAVGSLRDVDEAMLVDVGALLDDETRRRVTHVVQENARVLACAAALEAGDLASVGHLFAESHASLRDLYEVSSPELDALVEIATAIPGVAAARMTGAGFGGCTVNLVARDAIATFEKAVSAGYRDRTNLTPRVLAVEASAGAGVVRLDEATPAGPVAAPG